MKLTPLLALLLPLAPALAAPAAAPRTLVRYLSGHGAGDDIRWDFYCTGGRRSGDWTTIPVPSCWELQGFGTYQYGLVLRGKHPPPVADEQGKYRLEFHVPADWAGRTVRLVFQGVMTDAEVRVNGRLAGPVHQGAFYAFHYDITRLLDFNGPNLLQVTVSKESSNPSVNWAERRADYWNFGGIFRPVYLEAFPAQFIDRAAIDARADGTFTSEVHLGRPAAAAGEIRAQVVDGAGRPAGPACSAPLAAGASSAELRARFPGVKLWSAETPNLYRVRLTLLEGGRAEHEIVDAFGFRTFEVRPHDGLYLNGRKIVLKGVDRHSFWPSSGRTLSRAINYGDVRLMKEMNLNAVRLSHYPPDADFLAACDQLGLYVLDELAGWHGNYDTPTGRKLIGEMVRRDENHPSILFWDNGNETGWNAENDSQFDRWDLQRRPVLHPIGLFSGVDTIHYRSYAQTQARCAGPDIFMPTEFLHGLYDGGGGAGLDDYWNVMRNSPRCAGGFIWAFLDEGVVRTDENDRIDDVGDFAPDGVVGPYREKEGSFYTIRQIWSPVQVGFGPDLASGPGTLPDDFGGRLRVENRYDFLNLDQCRFDWALARFPGPLGWRAGHAVIARGELAGPDVPPGAAGEIALRLPPGWRDADVLYVTARDPEGRSLWTWSWTWPRAEPPAPAPAGLAPAAARDDGLQLSVLAGPVDIRFSKSTGELDELLVDGRLIPLRDGPRFVAVRRADRNPDGSVRAHPPKGEDRRYVEVQPPGKLTRLFARQDGRDVVVEADYDGPLRQALWRISPDGAVRVDTTYAYHGAVDLMGVTFAFPAADMRTIRWLGMGPYRVWQNRMKGTHLDVWRNFYHVTVPGDSFVFPEFKGYFRDWQWADFGTTAGRITVTHGSGGRFLGVYAPTPAPVDPLAVLPDTGLAFLDVIPAIRSKVHASDQLGPESQVRQVDGVFHSSVSFRFAAPAASVP
jgi:Glycosyl hydrolases family 2, TIM barrel domain/Glycosyl hydrolases family 2, sugar binding domain/Glycosyl hydrolases family 2/Beta galactosidase small chain